MKSEGTFQYTTLHGVVSRGRLRELHVGDVIVSIQAQVHGGIGPQRPFESLIIKT